MTDVDTDCTGQYASESDASTVSVETEMYRPPEPPKVRARSARDLVDRQEQLLTMLQKMRSDLAKMDREARHIKEDVVRSNQLFHVMVHMKQPHHLTPSLDGYHMSYSLPKVTYTYRRRHSDNDRSRHLNQLSTFWPSCTSSRRSSVSSRYSGRQRLDDEDDVSRRSSATSATGTGSRTSVSSATEDNCSGTESECDDPNSCHWSRERNIPDTPQESSESQTEAAGSSTESMSSFGRSSPEMERRLRRAGRRSSYFYTEASRRTDEVQPDEVDL